MKQSIVIAPLATIVLAFPAFTQGDLVVGREFAAVSDISSAIFPPGMDDSSCKWSWKERGCVPAQFCAYQHKRGDLSLGKSCRLVTDKIGRVPQQLHLSYAGTTTGTGMTISWTTYTKVEDPAVWISSKDQWSLQPVKAEIDVQSYYKEGKYSLYSYHATVTGLQPRTKYYYRVGSHSIAVFQSAINTFTTARPVNDNDSYEVAIYGDFGVDKNAQKTLEFVQKTVETTPIDFVYHIGDISYADNAFLHISEVSGFYYEETYNRWMNSMTKVMAKVPYMVLVGNHEAECHSPVCQLSKTKQAQLGNYTAYNARFKMPSAESGGVKNMWYSFEQGPVHFTSISSETDFPNAPHNSYNLGRIGKPFGGFGDQLKWLEEDLKKAHANRQNVPWIVVGMHRPLYSLRRYDEMGNPTADALRMQRTFEDLFIKYQVDVVVAGHVHAYERHYPIAKNQPVKDGVSADGKIYTNPKAPVYIVTGAAGNSEGLTTYTVLNSPWNVVVNAQDFGISTMKVTRDALTFKYLASATGQVKDEFMIIKKQSDNKQQQLQQKEYMNVTTA